MIHTGRVGAVLFLSFFMVMMTVALCAAPAPAPGTYNNNQYLSFTGTDAQVRFRIYVGENTEAGSSDEWELYTGPVELTALPGEERGYEVELKDGLRYRYRIDRKPPEPPGIVQERPLEVAFDSDAKVYYRIFAIDSEKKGAFTLWDGSPTAIPFSGMNIARIECYAEDDAGNRSPMAVDYAELPYRGPSSVPILSPPPGVYLNPQLFYIDTEGYEWVRYTIDDEDPVLRGAPYLSPLLIRSRGVVRLKVAALPAGSREPVRSEVTFAQYPDETVRIPASGLYSKPLSIDLPEGVSEYATVETGPPVKASNGSVTIKGIDGALSLHPLRFTIEGNAEEGEYRFLYVMDYRKPGAPGIELDKPLPFSGKIRVRMSAGEGDSIFYTLNGATPDRFALKYQRPFTIDASQWGEQGSVELRSVAYGTNGRPGNESRMLLPFDTVPPPAPRVEQSEISPGVYRFNVKTEQEECAVLYEIGFGDGAELPTSASPRGEDGMTVSFPRGSSGTAEIRFAAMDAAGNISHASRAETVTWDFLSPAPPVLAVENGTVTCSDGGNRLEYLLEELDPETGTPIESGAGGWLAYTSPVRLTAEEETLAAYRFSARALDAAGNTSPVTVREYLPVDNRTDFPLLVKGVPPGGVTGGEVVISIDTPASASCRYRLVSGEEEEGEFLAYDGPFTVRGNGGEDIVYALETVPYSEVTGRQGKPSRFSFRIDREPPKLPRIPAEALNTVYRENSYIPLPSASGEERYWYILEPAAEGTEAPSFERFVEQGRALPRRGTMYLDFGDVQGSHHLSFMAMDTAGNVSVSPEPSVIVYDSVPPEAPAVSARETEGGWNVQAVPGKEGRLENGKRDFFLPYQDSPFDPPETIELTSVDDAGNRSLPSRLAVRGKTLFIDGKALSSGTETETGSSGSAALSVSGLLADMNGDLPDADALVAGIPRHFWSSEPVTIRPSAGGTIRYELAIGSEARSVTDQSDQLKDALTISAAVGEAFHVSLNVALFADLGGKERAIASKRYRFGIDRNPPAPPAFIGVEDGQYYRNDRRIQFNHDEPEIASIRYRILKEGRSSGSGGDFLTYNREVSVTAEKGTYSEFRIEAYAVDEAGNRSAPAAVNFAIDKAVLYVAASAEEKGDGSRAAPYRSLSAALDDAVANGMTSIMLSEGKHILQKSADVKGAELTLEGGFSYPDWRPGIGITAVTTERSFGEEPLFRQEEGTLTLKNLSIDNLVSRSPILLQSGGLVTMEKVRLYQAAGAIDHAIGVDKGKLFIEDSTFRFGPLVSGSLITVNEGELSLTGTEIHGSSKSVNALLVRSGNSVITFDNCRIEPGESDGLTVISASGGSMTILGSELATGNGDSRSTGCRIDNGDLYILGSTFRSGTAGRISFLLDGKNSIMVIERSLFLSDGNEGSVQVKSFGGSLQATETVFARSSSSNGFIYGIQTENSGVSLYRTIFHYPAGGDTIALDCRNTPATVTESSFVLPPAGPAIGFAVRTDNPSALTLKSAHFISENRTGSAFFSPASLAGKAENGGGTFLEPGTLSSGAEAYPLFGAESVSSHPAGGYPELYRELQLADPLQ